MTLLKSTAISLLAAAILLPAACGGGGSISGGGGANVQTPGELGVRALLNADLAARRAQDLNARYNLESPSYRSACSPDHFALGAGNDWFGVSGHGANWGDIAARDVTVTVNGKTATIVFTVTAKGKDLFRVGDPNPYKVVYENGRWWKDDLRSDDFFGNPC